MLIYTEKTIEINCKKHGKQIAPLKTYKNRKKSKLNICPICFPYTYLGKLKQLYSDNLKKLGYEILDFNKEKNEVSLKNTSNGNIFILLKETFLGRLKKGIKIESPLTNETKFIEEYQNSLKKFGLIFIEYIKGEGLKLNCEKHGEFIVNKHLISHRLKIQNITPCPKCVNFNLLPKLKKIYGEKLKELGYEIIDYTTEKQIIKLKNLKDDNIFDLRYFTFKNRIDKNNIELDTPTELGEFFIHRYGEDFKKFGLEILPDKTIKCSIHGIITDTPSYKFMTDRIRLGVSPCIKCLPFKPTQSGMELNLLNFIKDIYKGTVISGNRKILGNKQEIDILLPNDNIGIEFNGLYWHNEEQTSKTYHKEKSDLAKSKGIFLYHFFEDEIIKSMYFLFNNLKDKNDINIDYLNNKYNLNISNLGKTFARETIIDLNIPKKEILPFLDEYHLQGKDYGVYKYLGLRYKKTNELISVMTFKKGDASKNIKNLEGEFELSRYCVKGGIQLVGGFEKLLKSFTESENNIKKIYTYSNGRYSNVENNVYLRSGFDLKGFTGIDYFYIYKGVRYSRFAFRKKKLYELLNDNTIDYNKYTEEDLYFIAKKKGIKINRIFGVGNYKWIKNISV